jgi:hypothetical protein
VRRTLRATAACLLAPVVLVACSSSGGDPLASADCDPLERPQLQEGSHLLGDQEPPVPYTSSPPTSGWHTSAPPLPAGAYADPITEPELVRVLEQGDVVLAYDPALPEDRIGQLQRLPSSVAGLVVTPYEQPMSSPLALVAWGVLQRCEDVTAQDVTAFRDAHAQELGH